MGFQSLHKALVLLGHPVLWIPGILAGLFSAAGIHFAFSGLEGAFYSERVVIFSLVVMPLFIAGVYGAVKTDDYSFRNFVKQGISGYFRVLLPTVLIMSAAFLFMLIVTMPVLISGASSSLLLASVFIIFFLPLLLVVFFYDTAAIFEDKKVFECIKRSLEASFARPVQILGFYAVLILVMLVLFTGISMVWSGILADQFEPLLTMNETELNSLAQNPEILFGMIGDYGVFVTSVISFIGTLLFTALFLVYKAVFYRDVLMDVKTVTGPGMTETQGEYDEKGRWYKYS
ncbi:hypothetical protein J2128_002558 [Methanomicrobium sp. W14]|uniref:DUF7847 domain-containing protein n=1 Tax=Methanomicrobium sp. W14 TaxID=2817839 RepID=UPI001AE44F06|nr:hypothetical protein [Methanomicrobium sp. W14]MBP2134587.1 hypothetical protein [Methanomicrobium sp. W14]